MRDFTLYTFKQLLLAFKNQNYIFLTFSGFLREPASKCVILRHDVDARKLNSLNCAMLEKELDITGTYYFRLTPRCFNPQIIKEISELGHEVGYHYEDLVTAHGNYNLARKLFEENLAKLRRVVPVETICMHGSPLSKYDNRRLWEKFNYRDYGIIGEPFLDINFENVLYLTDTGRRWDGDRVSIRDKVKIKGQKAKVVELMFRYEGQRAGRSFHSTFDIIEAANEDQLPDKIMLTIHPQRWDNRQLPWIRELVCQNIKNIGKRILISRSR